MNQLSPLLQRLITNHPIDTASLLRSMQISEVAALLEVLPAQQAGRLCVHLTPRITTRALSYMAPGHAAEVLSTMPRVNAAVLLRRLDDQASQRIVRALKKDTAVQLKRMLEYPEEVAGSLVDPLYLALMEEETVQQALEVMGQDPDTVNDHVYILDQNQHLTGYVTVKTLACAEAGDKLLEIRQPVVKVLSPETSLIRMVENEDLRRFDSLPVADASGLYLGALRRESLFFLGASIRNSHTCENARAAVQALGELYQLGLGGVIQTAENLSRQDNPQTRE